MLAVPRERLRGMVSKVDDRLLSEIRFLQLWRRHARSSGENVRRFSTKLPTLKSATNMK
jgi:hypothetical protein